METHCIHTKGRWAGKPVVFERWQRDDWHEALRVSPKTGKRLYSFVLQGRPRKNYKTTECSGLVLYLGGADGEPGAEIACGSGTKEQAGIVFGQASQFVQRSERLRSIFTPQSTVILVPATFGVIRRISSDGGFQMGMNLSGGVLDELHVFLTPKHRELFAAITTSTVLREEPFIASITTAGWDKATLLGELYDKFCALPNVEIHGKHGCKLVARNEAAGELMIWYGAPEDADIENEEIWRECNPAESVSLDFLRQQFNSTHVSEGEFRRLHLNQWTASEERWIPDSVVARNKRPDLLIPNGARIYGGVDASITHDTTACSWSWRTEQGVVVERTRVWSARKDVAHDVFVPGGRIDLELVSDFIVRELAPRYELSELVYDPRFFEGEASRLSRAGIRIAAFPQNSQLMADAYQAYYIDAHEGRSVWGGREEWNEHSDPRTLARHIAAAAGVKTERGWKISKLKSSRPIDAMVASVMSHARATAGDESVYEHRDLFVLGDADEHGDEDDDEWS